MKERLTLWIMLALLSLGPSPPVVTAADLSPGAKRLVDALLADWGERMHSTSIALAMDNLKLPPDDGLRREVGQYFRDNPNVANNIKFWGANNYILSNEEKRIAKYVINTYDSTDKLPTIDAMARDLEMSRSKLKDRLAFMEKVGLLKVSSETVLGYDLTDKYARWGGPLRYNYHTIRISGEKPYDVW